MAAVKVKQDELDELTAQLNALRADADATAAKIRELDESKLRCER